MEDRIKEVKKRWNGVSDSELVYVFENRLKIIEITRKSRFGISSCGL